ncbi:hypothetical protein OIDMADRAFT_149772 [Oidiodendron maius Zn]|uniref:protein-tyrosine-phosphatase n=1 Tax=Oidiodendron maius (strain Zn) TaxID=913774 RepID=A0A0C3GS42_OIDMZ|nr:hypothetical protein OIDMADRAFT_149772 [Oidiodendron maius Zn]
MHRNLRKASCGRSAGAKIQYYRMTQSATVDQFALLGLARHISTAPTPYLRFPHQMAKGQGGNKSRLRNNRAATLVYPPSLYLGPCSAASSPSFLKSHAITHILSIGATPSSQVPGVVYHRLALMDSQTSSISKVVATAVNIIDTAVAAEAGDKILVHCSAAVSRSPTIVAAYLMIKQKMSLKEALGRLILARPTVSPNTGFLRQLQELERELYGCVTLDIVELPRRREDRELLFKDVPTLPKS